MHYKNGRPAKAGDKVVNLSTGQTGILYDLHPTATSCNAKIAPLAGDNYSKNTSELLHLEDVQERPEVPPRQVVAKFSMGSKSSTTDGGAIVTLNPVVSGSPENERFYSLTPGGRIELSTVNPGAADFFEPGAQYYVTFRKA